MNFLALTSKRCSIRDYQSTPVEQEKIDYILEAARLAPSAVNFQPWYFLVIKEEKRRNNIIECYPREWIKPAPLFIVVCGDKSASWKRSSDNKDHLDIDGGIVTEHICLAATELNLGSCIVCNFNTELFCKYFNLPESVEPIAIIPIGYPTDQDLFAKAPKKRKEMHDIVKYESF